TNARLIPELAESWGVALDGRVYTFHLRAHTAWSTGEPITAQDVVYSWLRVLNPATASEYAGQLFYIKTGEAYNAGRINDPSLVGVKTLGDRTLRVELREPTAFFIDLCNYVTLRVVPGQDSDMHGDRWL